MKIKDKRLKIKEKGKRKKKKDKRRPGRNEKVILEELVGIYGNL